MRYALASNLSAEGKRVLLSKGIGILEPPVNDSVSLPVKHHSDLSFLFDGDSTVFIAKEIENYKIILEKIGLSVRVLPQKLGSKYPEDCKLNCVVTDKFIICNIDTVSSDVLQYFIRKGKEIISVKQGYTKCSVVPLCDEAIITDDKSICNSCTVKGIDVLLVTKGSVRLNGFDYGFIGGASGVIDKHTVAFNGDVTKHSDGEKIIDFLKKYGMSALSLDSGELWDIGSIIPLYSEV